MALTPILLPPPGSPEQRAVPRKNVAFEKYVTTLCALAVQASDRFDVTLGPPLASASVAGLAERSLAASAQPQFEYRLLAWCGREGNAGRVLIPYI